MYVKRDGIIVNIQVHLKQFIYLRIQIAGGQNFLMLICANFIYIVGVAVCSDNLCLI